ncbi:hypothetical protein A2U01_0103617, partial [Trifolium medium]|nr:hypothetical protein [Trifolium medium]
MVVQDWRVQQGGAACWLVGSWHHRQFKGKVEIVGYCLQIDAETCFGTACRAGRNA